MFSSPSFYGFICAPGNNLILSMIFYSIFLLFLLPTQIASLQAIISCILSPLSSLSSLIFQNLFKNSFQNACFYLIKLIQCLILNRGYQYYSIILFLTSHLMFIDISCTSFTNFRIDLCPGKLVSIFNHKQL